MARTKSIQLKTRIGPQASTKWVSNVMKSLGMSTKSALEEIAPNLSTTVATGNDVVRSVRGMFRQQANVNRTTNTLQNNKYMRFMRDAYKNALSDIKSGNINNQDRFAESMMGGGFSFGDEDTDYSDSGDINIDTGSTDAMINLTEQVQRNATAQIKTAKASTDAMIAVSAASMYQSQQMNAEIVGQLETINKNLAAIVQFNNENFNQFIKASTAYYERMGATFAGEEDNGKQELRGISSTDVFNNGRGGINIGNYKQYVRQNFENLTDSGTIGFVKTMLSEEMLQMAASNPLGFASDALVKWMMPKVVTETIKNVETTYTKFAPKMLIEIGKWADSSSGGLMGSLKQAIGQVFGLRYDKGPASLRGAKVNREAISFDGETKHAITEIITKELREQTAYLKIMTEKMTGLKGVDLTNRFNAEQNYWDYKTNSYITGKAEINKSISSTIVESIRDVFNSNDLGRELNKLVTSQVDSNGKVDKAKQAEVQRGLDELFLRIALDKDGTIKPTELTKVANKLGVSVEVRKIIGERIDFLEKRNLGALASDISMGRIQGSAARSRSMNDILQNPTAYNLFSSDFNNSRFDDLEDDEKREEFRKLMMESMGYGTNRNRKDKGYKLKDYNKVSESLEENPYEPQLTEEQKKNPFARFGLNLSNMMSSIMSGKKVTDAFTDMIGSQAKLLFERANLALFGAKTTDGRHRTGGIFSDLSNQIRDYFVGTTASTDGRIKIDPASAVGKVAGFFEKGVAGWFTVFFGEDPNKVDPNSGKFTSEFKTNLEKKIKETLPSMEKGAFAGAGIGLLSMGGALGNLIGGPIGGAAFGAAAGFLAKNEKFQNWLFGEKDENGDRVGGLISKRVQEFFKRNKTAAGVGGAIGAGVGAVTGAGVLGNLVGGPLAGAVIGAASGLLTKTGLFNRFLYGDEDGHNGIFRLIQTSWKKGTGDKDLNIGAKAASMAGLGAVGGALMSKFGILGAAVLPGGPIGGAIAGLSLSIAANAKTFRNYLFGGDVALDKDGNPIKINGKDIKKVGVLGKIGANIETNLINPVRTSIINTVTKTALNIESGILTPFKYMSAFLARTIGKIATSPFKLMHGLGKAFLGLLQNTTIGKIAGTVGSGILDVAGAAGNAILNLPAKATSGFLRIFAPDLAAQMDTELSMNRKAKQNLKQLHKINKQHDKNASIIAKYTDGRYTEDTMEARDYLAQYNPQAYYKYFGEINGKNRGKLNKGQILAKDHDAYKARLQNQARILDVDNNIVGLETEEVQAKFAHKSAYYVEKLFDYISGKPTGVRNDNGQTVTESLDERIQKADWRDSRNPLEWLKNLPHNIKARFMLRSAFNNATDSGFVNGVRRLGRNGKGFLASLFEEGSPGNEFFSEGSGGGGFGPGDNVQGLPVRIVGVENGALNVSNTASPLVGNMFQSAGAVVAGHGKSAIDKGVQIEEKHELIRLENEKNYQAEMLKEVKALRDNTEDLGDENSSGKKKSIFSKILSALGGTGSVLGKIFSKKGLLVTGLLIGLPYLSKIIKWFTNNGETITTSLTAIGSAVKGILSTLGYAASDVATQYAQKHDTPESDSTNGDTSIADKAENLYDTGQLFNPSLVDDDGNSTAATGTKMRILSRLVSMYQTKNVRLKHTPAKKQSWLGKLTDLIPGVKNIKKLNPAKKVNDYTGNFNKRAEIISDATGSSSTFMDRLAEKAPNIPKTVSEKFKSLISNAKISAEKGSATSVDNIILAIDSFITKLIDGVKSSKLSKYGESFLKALDTLKTKTKNIVDDLIKNNSDEFVDAAKKEVLQETGAKEAAQAVGQDAANLATLGLTTLVFGTIGAIDGYTAASNIFETNDPDDLMKEISSVIYAIDWAFPEQVTMTVIDVTISVIEALTGENLIRTLASTIYYTAQGNNYLATSRLKIGQSAANLEYDAYKERELKSQYETQKKLGLISSSMSFENFRTGTRTGETHGAYLSGADYRNNQNESISSTLGGVLGNAINLMPLYGGYNLIKNSKAYTDANGNKYYKGYNDKYAVYGTDNKYIGEVAEDYINENQDKFTKNNFFSGLFKGGHWSEIVSKHFENSGLDAKWYNNPFESIKQIFTKRDKNEEAVGVVYVPIPTEDSQPYYYYKLNKNGKTYDTYYINGELWDKTELTMEDMKRLVESGDLSIQQESDILSSDYDKESLKKLKTEVDNEWLESQKSQSIFNKVKNFFSGTSDTSTSQVASSGFGVGGGFGQSQNAPGRSNKFIPNTNGATYGRAGCGFAAVGNVTGESAEEVAKYMPFNNKYGTTYDSIRTALRHKGLNFSEYANPNANTMGGGAGGFGFGKGNELYNIYNSKYPRGHWLTGYGSDGNGNTFISDPETGKDYAVPSNVLASQTARMFRVGGGYGANEQYSDEIDAFIKNPNNYAWIIAQPEVDLGMTYADFDTGKGTGYIDEWTKVALLNPSVRDRVGKEIGKIHAGEKREARINERNAANIAAGKTFEENEAKYQAQLLAEQQASDAYLNQQINQTKADSDKYLEQYKNAKASKKKANYMANIAAGKTFEENEAKYQAQLLAEQQSEAAFINKQSSDNIAFLQSDWEAYKSNKAQKQAKRDAENKLMLYGNEAQIISEGNEAALGRAVSNKDIKEIYVNELSKIVGSGKVSTNMSMEELEKLGSKTKIGNGNFNEIMMQAINDNNSDIGKYKGKQASELLERRLKYYTAKYSATSDDDLSWVESNEDLMMRAPKTNNKLRKADRIIQTGTADKATIEKNRGTAYNAGGKKTKATGYAYKAGDEIHYAGGRTVKTKSKTDKTGSKTGTNTSAELAYAKGRKAGTTSKRGTAYTPMYNKSSKTDSSAATLASTTSTPSTTTTTASSGNVSLYDAYPIGYFTDTLGMDSDMAEYVRDKAIQQCLDNDTIDTMSMSSAMSTWYYTYKNNNNIDDGKSVNFFQNQPDLTATTSSKASSTAGNTSKEGTSTTSTTSTTGTKAVKTDTAAEIARSYGTSGYKPDTTTTSTKGTTTSAMIAQQYGTIGYKAKPDYNKTTSSTTGANTKKKSTTGKSGSVTTATRGTPYTPGYDGGDDVGGGGQSWLDTVAGCKQAVASQIGAYSQANTTTVTVGDKPYKVRADCSGFVSLCLQVFGSFPEGFLATSAGFGSNNNYLSADGWTHLDWPGWDGLEPGDIIAEPGAHVEIFAGNNGSAHMTFNYGSNSSASNPGATTDGGTHNYQHVWRPKAGATSKNYAGGSYSGTGSGGTSGSSSASGSSSGSSSGSGLFSRLLSGISGFFGEFFDRGIKGIMTGEWDTDYSGFISQYTNGGSSSGSSGSTSGGTSFSGNIPAANIDSSKSAEETWKFLTGKGITKEGAAGIMGNLQVESGIQSNNLQNTGNSRLGMSDEQYTSAVDNGSYPNFAGDKIGYGIAQWTSSGRKQGLYDMAKANNRSIGDLGNQLGWLYQELSTGYKGTLGQMENASSVEQAAIDFQEGYERAGIPNMDKRISYAKGFYDTYKDLGTTTTATRGTPYTPGYDGGDDVGGGGGGFGRSSIVNRNYSSSPIVGPSQEVNRYHRVGGGYGLGDYSEDFKSANKAEKAVNNNDEMKKFDTYMNNIISALSIISTNTGNTVQGLGAIAKMGGNTTVLNGGTVNDNSFSINPKTGMPDRGYSSIYSTRDGVMASQLAGNNTNTVNPMMYGKSSN